MQPRFKAVGLPKPWQVPPGLEERLLDGVPRALLVAEDPERDRQQRWLATSISSRNAAWSPARARSTSLTSTHRTSCAPDRPAVTHFLWP